MILNRYQAVLLDMNGTFMFGEDRFGPAHDYHATYRELGGTRLPPDALRQIVGRCYEHMFARYGDPHCVGCFPQFAAVLSESCTDLPAAEIGLIEAVFARHELGQVPGQYTAALHRLAKTHGLGVVTNIWSQKPPWLEELRRAGVLDLFKALVFSSDGPSIKPSPALFRQAMGVSGVPPSAAVYVGDSPRCDVGGAAAAGLDAVWVNPRGAARAVGSPAPTFEVRGLLDLVPAT